MQGLPVHARARPTRRGTGCGLLPLSASHGLIKGSKIEVDYPCWPGANAQSGQCRPHSVLSAWTGKWAPVITVPQTEAPSLQNHRKGKQWSPAPLYLQELGRPAKVVWRVQNKQEAFFFQE